MLRDILTELIKRMLKSLLNRKIPNIKISYMLSQTIFGPQYQKVQKKFSNNVSKYYF